MQIIVYLWYLIGLIVISLSKSFLHELFHYTFLGKFKINSTIKVDFRKFGLFYNYIDDKKELPKLKKLDNCKIWLIFISGSFSDFLFLLVSSIAFWIYFRNKLISFFFGFMALVFIINLLLNLFFGDGKKAKKIIGEKFI